MADGKRPLVPVGESPRRYMSGRTPQSARATRLGLASVERAFLIAYMGLFRGDGLFSNVSGTVVTEDL